MQDKRLKIFISYTQDSEAHKARVLNLADRLNDEGLDCNIDQYEAAPSEGWPRWMQKQIEDADFILVVCTETYCRRIELKEQPGKGLGGIWEGAIITDMLYNQSTLNPNIIPILFAAEDTQYIPRILGGVMHYYVNTEEGYIALYRRLTDQPFIEKPPLGASKILSRRQRNTTPEKKS